MTKIVIKNKNSYGYKENIYYLKQLKNLINK